MKKTQLHDMQSNKLILLGQLLSGVLHELKQPLTGIKGFTQAGLMDLEEGDPLSRDFRKILEQVQRIEKMINDFYLFSQSNSSEAVSLDINALIESSFVFLDEQLRAHKIRVSKSLADNLPKVKGVPGQLQQVFLNLIVNARDALGLPDKPYGGEISVRSVLSRNKKNIEVSFVAAMKDVKRSPSMAEGESLRSRKLLLPILRRIINNHQGKLEVRNKKNSAVNFKIILPV